MTDADSPTAAKRQKLDEPDLIDAEREITEKSLADNQQCSKNTETEQAKSKASENGRKLPETADKDTVKKPVSEKQTEKKEAAVSSHPTEKDVGINEYISKTSGFQGVIKQRFSDFLVHEINLEGKTVRFTSTELPVPDDAELDNKVGKDVSGKLPDDKIEEIAKLVKSKDRSKSVLISVGDDKSERANIHQAVSEGFPGMDSATVTRDNKKYIEVKFFSGQANYLRHWPKGRGDYCRFVLYKENKDTMDAISLMAKQIGLRASLFQYAGTKDRRAKTSQEVTVYRVVAEKLLKNNKRLRNIVAGNFRYVKEPLKLGQLLGNKFTIVLRSVTGSADQVEAAVRSLREVGFINYYGMQRFGTMSIPTHHIGRAILQENWKEAVELILKPREGDDPETAQGREAWWNSRNSRAALSKFPRRCFIERCVLQGLADTGENNYLGALNKIPRNTRLMYVHGYQSYIWNKVTSYRIRELGLAPVVGDLVISKHLHTDTPDVEDEAASEERDKSKKPSPTLVTDDNIAEYSIEDVVLPLPGYDVVYPSNVKEQYKSLMELDGLDCDNMRHKVKDYSLSGDNRHILVKPGEVSCTTFLYNDVNAPLALSDQDIIDKVPEPQTIPDSAHTAVRLELTLPTSCYATMAIREILKTDTSPAYQDYSLSGDNRHILVKPGKVSCTTFLYNDVNAPLALSDQDIIDKVPEPQTIPDGAHTAVRLELTLPTSCYATMAIREILKTDTSPAYQSTLNVT